MPLSITLIPLTATHKFSTFSRTTIYNPKDSYLVSKSLNMKNIKINTTNKYTFELAEIHGILCI